VQTQPGSFHWNEAYDPLLDFWFWLRDQDRLTDEDLHLRINECGRSSAGESALAALSNNAWAEFAPLAVTRKASRAASRLEALAPGRLKSYYEAMAALGVPAFRVRWVTAPFGQRWFVAPDMIILGSDGANTDACRDAVMRAALDYLGT
jgi:hypothetical protein